MNVGMQTNAGEEQQRFESGATRSKMDVRYDLIPSAALRRLARRYAVGADIHGDHNWKNGIPASAMVNHLLAHVDHFRDLLEKLQRGEAVDWSQEDDDLAAIAWGAFGLMWFQERLPEVLAK